MAYRTTKSGSDTIGLGRWSWIQVAGKNGLRTRIITAYRPCRVTGSKGLTTTWDQQERYFRKHNNSYGSRKNFDIDLFTIINN